MSYQKTSPPNKDEMRVHQSEERIKKRESQGDHECEVWAYDQLDVDWRQELTGEEGSAEWEKCEKNPGHTGFIPAPDFGLHHLPEEYRTAEMLELVQVQAELTVRLRVRYTSAHRPDGYPFSEFKGRRIPHTGTGVVTYAGIDRHSHRFAESDEESTESDDDDEESCGEEDDDDRDEETKRRDFQQYEEASRRPAFTESDCPCHDCEDKRFYAKQKQLRIAAAEDNAEGAVGSYTVTQSKGKQVGERPQNFGTVEKPSPAQQAVAEDVMQTDSPSPRRPEQLQERPCFLVTIQTAMHVVYDSEEARHTVADVFYDSNRSNSPTLRLYGVRVEEIFKEEDKCLFQCCTHNEELVDRLYAALNKRYRLSKALGRPKTPPTVEDSNGTVTAISDSADASSAFASSSTGKGEDVDGASLPKAGVPDRAGGKESTPSTVAAQHSPEQATPETRPEGAAGPSLPSPQASRMTIVTGHPHGRGKTISVGQWIQRVKDSESEHLMVTHYIYDAPTCKGNSGGSVLTFGKLEEERATVLISTHCHRSSCKTPGLNMSSSCFEGKKILFETNKRK